VFWLVRHGETAWDLPGQQRHQGLLDLPLSDVGRATIRRTIAYLQAQTDVTYAPTIPTSPLPRALESMQLIADALGLIVVPEPQLLPWDIGGLAGTPEQDPETDPLSFYIRRSDLAPPGGQALNAFLAQALAYIVPAATRNLAVVQLAGGHSRHVQAVQFTKRGKRVFGGVTSGSGVGPGDVLWVNPDLSWTVMKMRGPDAQVAA
jgi:broad specificity phosphatase PhoE